MTTLVPEDSTYLNMIPYTLTHALMGDLDASDGWKKLLMAVESSQDDGPLWTLALKLSLSCVTAEWRVPQKSFLVTLARKDIGFTT